MTRRERLMATLRGEPVDRPAVSFYEVGGFNVDPADPSDLNIYNDPSWQPLLALAEGRTDLMRMRGPRLVAAPDNPREEFFRSQTQREPGFWETRTTLTVAGRTMTALARRNGDMDTVWYTDHLLESPDDVEAYLELPDEVFAYTPDVAGIRAADEEVADRGIVMVDAADPIGLAASLFSMADFTVIALTEQALFHRLLEKLAGPIHERTAAVADAVPGHLWRICGAEYATEPYLPPRLFDEYVARYTAPMIESIHAHGGFVRLHCHGRLRTALPYIVAMGADATDPIEPPPSGDVPLAEVRSRYGRELALFGNLEVRDIENMPPAQFEQVVAASLRDGTAGEGKGFVLMPSACPCGRTVTPRTLANYETMVRLATAFGG